MIHGTFMAEAMTEYLDGKTLKALLVDSTHYDDPALTNRADIATEVFGNGYVEGGVVVDQPVVTYFGGVLTLVIDAINFGVVSLPDIAALVVYVDTGDAATDRLLWTDNNFAPTSSSEAEGELVYTPPPAGSIQINF